MEDDKKPKDFFSIIEKEVIAERIENPFDDDEVIFKDESGNIKIIKSSQTKEFEKSAIPASPGASLDVRSDSSETRRESKRASQGGQPTITTNVKTKILPSVAVKPSSKPLDVEKDIQIVIKNSGIHFNDSELEKRFKNIVRLRLKGVRSSVVTREAFLNSIVNGGMGFDSPHVDQLINVINSQLGQLDDKIRVQASQQPFSDLQAEASALLNGVKDFAPTFGKPELVFKPKKEIVKDSTAQRVVPKTPPAPKIKLPRIARVIVKTDDSKPKIEDVRFQPKLTGPIEEIRSMTVNDFRRLGESPEQIVQKIIEKIDILEEESFSRKTEAIRAWKESSVNRLYLELGDESMENKLSISEVIANRQQNDKPYLTEEEIDTIIDLNHKLRF